MNSTKKDFLSPVKRSTLTADICRKLVAHLIRGDWEEGEQIPPERELSLKLGVGRASLREALKALEIMGMIETRLGEGTFVCHRSEFLSRPLLWAITATNSSEVRELIEARRLIEGELARLAAERAVAAEVKEIGTQLDRMHTSLGNINEFQEADISFHLAIAHAAHNRILLNALQLTRNLMRQWIQTSLTREGVALEAFEQHNEIFLAIAKKNPERAVAAMRQHLDAMAKHLAVEEKQNSPNPAVTPGHDNGLDGDPTGS